MDLLLLFISIILFVYPFVDLFLLSKTITKLQEVAPSIISYTDKINIQDTNTLRSIFTYMSPKLIKEHFTNKKEYRTYKRSFYFFIWYFSSGFIAIILNIIVLFLSLYNLSNSKLEICLIFCVMNICVLWIFKLSSIFHLWGLNRLAYTIDTIVNAIFSPNGKVNEFIYKISVKILLYIIDLIAFLLFFKYSNIIIQRYADVDFLIVFAELVFYQYVFGKITSFCISKIYWKKGKNSHKFKNFQSLLTYHNDIFKNTTYLVLLTIYIINKYVQILSQDTTYNLILIEAIGALFLLDTYLEKNKATDSHILSECKHFEENTQQVPREETKMKSNDIMSSNEKTNTLKIDINNTAIPEYLEVVKSEYETERNKKQSFETRSGLLLTLLGAIMIFYFQSIKLTDIFILFSKPLTFTLWVKIISGCSIYGTFIFTFIAIINTISAKKHDNFETNGINEQLLVEDRINAMTRLIFTYREIIQQHRISNEKRAKWYIASLLSMLLLLLSTILYISL